MKEGGRAPRVADYLRRELAEIIRREMRDPRVGMVSINDARVSRDLAYADIYVSALGVTEPGEREELIRVLNGAGGFLRSAVARASTMRTTPRLRFHYDTVVEEGRRVERLIDHALRSDQRLRDDPEGDEQR